MDRGDIITTRSHHNAIVPWEPAEPLAGWREYVASAPKRDPPPGEVEQVLRLRHLAPFASLAGRGDSLAPICDRGHAHMATAVMGDGSAGVSGGLVVQPFSQAVRLDVELVPHPAPEGRPPTPAPRDDRHLR